MVDAPGIDDKYMATEVGSYIEDNRDKVIPLFIIPLTNGGIELYIYDKLKKTLKEMNNFKPIVIFTKFDNLLNDIKVDISTEGLEF
jgi:hypothetical protein